MYNSLILETPLYPEMKINDFFQIFGLQPWSIAWIRAIWKHFYLILVPNFVIFVRNRDMGWVLKPNNRPKSRKVRPGLQYMWLIQRTRVLVVASVYGIAFKSIFLNIYINRFWILIHLLWTSICCVYFKPVNMAIV